MSLDDLAPLARRSVEEISTKPFTFQALVDDFIAAQVHRALMEYAMDMHFYLWGVPCGPTLSMTEPPKWNGLEALL